MPSGSSLVGRRHKKGESMMTVAVVGAGYVGLVTGACFASKGFRVIIIENNHEKIDLLLAGKIPFYEPGLDTLVIEGIKNKNLVFVPTIKEGLAYQPEVVFSCVGTPSLPSGAADLSYVEQVAREIGRCANGYLLVVNKSTVPVGTARKVKSSIYEHMAQRGMAVHCDVASNPEFLKEGSAVDDFLYPDRVVVGVDSDQAATLLHKLYKPFITNESQFICMNIESAELTKYASNVMLAMRISFINQLAQLADKVGADIKEVKEGMAKDARIGPHFLNAGIGYGGSCFPKDVKALITMGNDCHFPMTLAQEIDNINTFQRVWFVNRIIAHYGPRLAGKTVGLWGLAFKPETDDIRCAPSIDVIDELLSHRARIVAYDPVAHANVAARYGGSVNFATSAHEVLATADFLVILTEWKPFLQCKPHDFAQLADKTVFDGRNCFEPSLMHAAGITYVCVGRNTTMRDEHVRQTNAKKQKQPYEAAL